MLHIIWTIINAVLILYFLHLIIGFVVIGKRIFQNRLKKFSIFILVLGGLQILTSYVDKEEKDNNYIVINEAAFNPKKSIIKTIKLEESFLKDFMLSVKYSYKNNTFVPINGSTRMAGFNSGYKWKLTGMNISNYTNDKKGTYHVYGILEWHLLGLKIYSQLKRFKGVIE